MGWQIVGSPEAAHGQLLGRALRLTCGRPVRALTATGCTPCLLLMWQTPRLATAGRVDTAGTLSRRGMLVEAVAGFGVVMMLFMLVMVGLMIAGFGLWIWAFVDVVKKPEWTFASNNKTLWAIVVGLGGPIGAVVYMAVGRPRVGRA